MRGSGSPVERATAAGAFLTPDRVAVAVLALLITLLFADVLVGVNSLYLRDITHYYYPVRHAVREVVLGGEFPWWLRTFSAGQPLAANPEHEVFYPLTWLILLPDYDFAFHLFIVVHMLIGAAAMYALLRSMRCRPPAAFLGALSFVLGGVFLSYLVLLPYLASAAWLPAVCLFARRYLLHRARRDLALAALSLGVMIVIGEPTTILQTGFLLGAYALYRTGLRGVAMVALICVAALLVGAVQALPAADHARDSVRARGFPFPEVTDFSTPPARLAELFFSDLLGEKRGALYGVRRAPFLYSIYPGMLVAGLTLGGIIARVRGWPLVLALIAVSVLLAMGSHTPLWRLLYDIGVARSLRFPEKFILTGAFAMTVFAARVFDRLEIRRPLWIAAIAALVTLDLGRALPVVAPRVERAYFTRPPALEGQLPPNRSEYRLYHHAVRHSSRPEVRPYFARHRETYWVYRNAMLGMIPARYGIQTAIDVDFDLTTLQPTADFVDAAWKLARWRRDWADVAASMSNVWFRAVFNAPADAFAESHGDRRTLQPVRILPFAPYPRYFFARQVESIRDHDDFVRKLASRRFGKGTAFVRGPSFTPAPGRVLRVQETSSRARIDVETAGPAFLVMSVTPHKYWTVTVDGTEAPAVVTNVGYQGVMIRGAGRHVVEMRYRNPLVVAGGAISAAALLAVLLAARRA